MRVGQALGLRHEDVFSWERRIEIVPGEVEGGARGSVPVPGELIRLWSDYMHEEYGDRHRRTIEALLEHVSSGRLRAVEGPSFPLANAARAHISVAA